MITAYLETDRLLIAALETDEYVFIINLVNSPGWLNFIGDKKVTDEASAKIYIENIISNKNTIYNVIRIKEDNTPIGIISFIKRETYNFPDLGFALLPEFEGKGYAYEAALAYLNFQKQHHEEIIAITLNHNRASIKLLETIRFSIQRIR